MYKAIRTLIITVLVSVLLAGKCLPCRDLFAKSTPRSCCDKSGACTRVPEKSSNDKPCPLQYTQLAIEKDQKDNLRTLTPALAVVVWTLTAATPPVPLQVARPVAFVPAYTPPLLYLLHERILV